MATLAAMAHHGGQRDKAKHPRRGDGKFGHGTVTKPPSAARKTR